MCFFFFWQANGTNYLIWSRTTVCIYINLYTRNIYEWVFAQVISMSALRDFWPEKIQKKSEKRRFRKKNNFIYALHFFVSLTFCTYLKRLTSVSGLTEQISRSAEILYNMYMYFYSYAYKYMSVICFLCPLSFILSPLSRTWWLEMRKLSEKNTSQRAKHVSFLQPLDKYEKKIFIFFGGGSLSSSDW